MKDALSARARAESRVLLSQLASRWAHVQGVAARAEHLAQALEPVDRPAVVASAWLHDIGYAREVGFTGFHPLDGARYLRDRGWPPVVTQLVAHHTGAWAEASERGLRAQLDEFPEPRKVLLDALTASDLTVGPDGAAISVHDRLADIHARYAPDSPVSRAISRSRPQLMASAERALDRLGHVGTA